MSFFSAYPQIIKLCKKKKIKYKETWETKRKHPHKKNFCKLGTADDWMNLHLYLK